MINRQEGLSTADLAGRSRDTDSDGVPDAAERPENVEGTMAAPTSVTAKADDNGAPLFAPGDAEGYRSRWTEVQTGFVDDPRHTVEQADTLVAEVMKRLAEVFADERATLEEQWSRGEEADTESLRVALRRYRSFFDRLLSVWATPLTIRRPASAGLLQVLRHWVQLRGRLRKVLSSSVFTVCGRPGWHHWTA